MHQNIYKLDLDNPIRPDDNASLFRIFYPETMGIVVNKEQSHWVAIKLINSAIWLLDSTEEPELKSFDAYREYLQTEGYRSFALVTHFD